MLLRELDVTSDWILFHKDIKTLEIYSYIISLMIYIYGTYSIKVLNHWISMHM